jgi:hypothetical protein
LTDQTELLRQRGMASHALTDVRAALRDPAHRVDEDVDLLERVVERKRRANRSLQTEATQNRLSAVMAGAHRDAFGLSALPTSSGSCPAGTNDSTLAFSSVVPTRQPQLLGDLVVRT